MRAQNGSGWAAFFDTRPKDDAAFFTRLDQDPWTALNGAHDAFLAGDLFTSYGADGKATTGGDNTDTLLSSDGAGAVVDETFRAGEKFPRVHTEVRNVQFLYDDGADAHFMDEETFEQFGLPQIGRAHV